MLLKFKKVQSCRDENKNSNLTLAEEDGNERSGDFGMRGRSHMNTYQGGQNRSKEC